MIKLCFIKFSIVAEQITKYSGFAYVTFRRCIIRNLKKDISTVCRH